MTTMISPPRTMDLDDFLDLPEGPPYYEREPGGEVIEMPSATDRHNGLMGALYAELRGWVRQRRLGKVSMAVDVTFPSGRVNIPDLTFMSAGGLARVEDDGKIHGVPTMVVELISPGGQTRDRVDRFDAYRDEGVEWYWLIDSQTLDVEEYHLEGGRYVCTSRHAGGSVFRPLVFPELEIDFAALMAE